MNDIEPDILDQGDENPAGVGDSGPLEMGGIQLLHSNLAQAKIVRGVYQRTSGATNVITRPIEQQLGKLIGIK